MSSPQVRVKPAPTFHPVTYFSGVHNAAVCRAAQRRRDIGLLVTPLVPHLAEAVQAYPVAAIDNGVFSTTRRFDPDKFVRLLKRVERWKRKMRFVVAPDVVCNAEATLEQFQRWSELIGDMGYPVALVGQNGLEFLQSQIPWGHFDVFFVGGDTNWKMGRLEGDSLWAWQRMMQEIRDRGIPIHVGRVNSYERLEAAAYDMAATSVDGTCIAFHPQKNLRLLEQWLTLYNECGHKMGRPHGAEYCDGADLDWYLFGRKERIKWEKRSYGWSETELFGECDWETDTKQPCHASIELFPETPPDRNSLPENPEPPLQGPVYRPGEAA